MSKQMGPSLRRSFKRTSVSRRVSAVRGANSRALEIPPSATRIEFSKGRMSVAVRIRPLAASEAAQRRIVSALDERRLIFDPKGEFEDFDDLRMPKVQGSRIVHNSERNELFDLDRVFDENSDNFAVYEDTVLPLLVSFLDGYNCSVFAYGATGSGKTHTMMGHDDTRGIVSFTMDKLFEELGCLETEHTIDIKASYFEIYNETILDLLRPNASNVKGLDLRENGKAVVISGLSYHAITKMDQILELIEDGGKRRSQSETLSNQKSSRSHAIFQINVKMMNKKTRALQESKLSLIDLAGCERAAGVTSSKDRFKEGTNINKSLLALGNCINALADTRRRGHVPYRDSKLTRILKDSLGGSALTLMIAAISPAHTSYENTLKTLQYAQRARKIETHVTKNHKMAFGGVTNYTTLMNTMNKELTELKTSNTQLQAQLKAEKTRCSLLEEKLEELGNGEKEIVRDEVRSSVDDDTKDLFKSFTLARLRELESISALKEVQFKRHLNTAERVQSSTATKGLQTSLKAVEIAGKRREDLERRVNSIRTKFTTEVLLPYDCQYLVDTTQREAQESQSLASKLLQNQQNKIVSLTSLRNDSVSLLDQVVCILRGMNQLTSDIEGRYRRLKHCNDDLLRNKVTFIEDQPGIVSPMTRIMCFNNIDDSDLLSVPPENDTPVHYLPFSTPPNHHLNETFKLVPHTLRSALKKTMTSTTSSLSNIVNHSNPFGNPSGTSRTLKMKSTVQKSLTRCFSSRSVAVAELGRQRSAERKPSWR